MPIHHILIAILSMLVTSRACARNLRVKVYP